MNFRKKSKVTKCFAAALSIFLLSSSVNLHVAYASATINGVNGTSIDFSEMDSTPVVATPNITLSSSSDFGSNSYIEFSITDANAFDQLGMQQVADAASISTESGKISVYGGIVYMGNGSTYDAIGSIDSVENGENGKDLKIAFKRTLPNANFLEGQTNTCFSDGNTLEGWTIKNGVYDLYGNGLNLRSNGKKYTSMTASEDKTSVAIAGTDKNSAPYTYNSNWYIPGVSVNPFSNNYESAWEYESVERPDPSSQWGPFTTTVSIDDTAGGSGGRSLKLTSSGIVLADNSGASDPHGSGSYGSGIEKYGSAFGPVVTSNSFTAKAGEKISIDWKAVRQSDDYEVYGYVKNVDTGVYTLVFYGRGASQPWTTTEGTIPNDGTYQFVFINGTYDQTGGFAVGSYLWIDNIQVYGSTYSAQVAQDIALLATYKCTSEDPSNKRTLNVKVVDEDGESSAATASSTINIINQYSHPPVITVTSANPAYNKGAGGQDILFSNADATTVETTEDFRELDLSATGILDGSNECLVADGTEIPLISGTGTTSDHSISYNVTTNGSSAEIVFTNIGLHDADMNTFINNLKYKNSLAKLTPGSRVFELLKIIDSGSNTDKSENETALSVTSTVAASNVITDFASTNRAATTADFTWSEVTGATSMKIQKSTNDGSSWSDASTSSTLATDSTSATVTGLSASSGYKFRLIVTGGDNAGISNIVSVGKSSTVNTLLTSGKYNVSDGETSSETITNVPYNTSKDTLLANLAKNVEGQTINSSNVHDPVQTGDKIVVTAADGSTKTTYTINVNPKPPAEDQPIIGIDYENSKLTGFTTGSTYTIETTTTSSASASINIQDDWFGKDVSIVKNGDGSSSSDSDELVLTIPSRPSTPTATGVNETYLGGNDGQITGVDGTMEYSTDQKQWIDINESDITGLPSGTYYVRVKAIPDTSFASAIETVTVGSDDAVPQSTPDIQLDFKNEELIGFTTGSAYSINGTTSTAFSINISDDWFGTDVSVVSKGNGTTKTDSDPQIISIPARPASPSAAIEISKSSDSIAVLNQDDFDNCEYSIDGKTWKNTGAFTGLNSGEDYTIYVRTKATNSSFCSVPSIKKVTTDTKNADIRTLSGIVTDENDNALSGVSIKLTKSGTNGLVLAQTTTDENGKFTISGLSDGAYSLVATKDGKTITKSILINGKDVVQNITMFTGNENTYLEVVGDTTSVAVDNLENMFTSDDKETAKTNSVKIKLVVEEESKDGLSADEKEKIDHLLSSQGKIGVYLDLKLQKTVNDGETENIQPPTGQTVKITVSIPTELQNKAPYAIIRIHEGTAEVLDAEYDSVLQTLTFEADKFSTYAIMYTGEAKSTDSTNYSITASASDGGNIAPSGIATVQEGENKSYEITPESGYSIDDVLVDGVSVGAVASYTFDAVGADHTIKAVFEKSSSNNGSSVGGGSASSTTGSTTIDNATNNTAQTDVNTNNESAENPFTDISSNDWFYNSVLNVYSKGLMQGISDNGFGPNISTTRGMIATIVYRIDNSNEKIDSTFSDVAKDKYYYTPIGWAEKHKVVEGYGNGKYGPDNKVTREQLVAILWRYAGFPETKNYNKLTQFTDYNEISNYAKPALEWACENGIITGKGNNTLDPKGVATRAELARILNCYLAISEK